MKSRIYMRSILLSSLVSISIGGLLLHAGTHPPAATVVSWIPLACGMVSALAIPVLFLSRKTLHWAYVLNGFTVIVGVITMAHYSISALAHPFGARDLFLDSTLASILILLGKFSVGKALFDLEVFGFDPQKERKGVWWRYPNLGWWWVHLAAVAAVYVLGAWLWK